MQDVLQTESIPERSSEEFGERTLCPWFCIKRKIDLLRQKKEAPKLQAKKHDYMADVIILLVVTPDDTR